MLDFMRPRSAPALLLCGLTLLTDDAARADSDNSVPALTPAQITELISGPPASAAAKSPAMGSAQASQLNWQQWGEAESTAQSVVDAPVANWGLLPDAPAEDYSALSALAENSAQAQANWQPFGVQGEIYRVKRLSLGRRQEGEASWYGPGFNGRRTASGEVFNMHALSAAHRTLPLPSFVRVTNIRNGKSVIVRVNDRGPYHSNRIIDLSYAAARLLDMNGTAQVALEAVDSEEKTGRHRGGIELGSDTAYAVLLGNFASSDQAQVLQGRLMTRLPTGIPVALRTTAAPIVVHRIEVGPLASALEVNVLIRSIRAVRMGFAEEPLRIKPGKPR